MTIGMGFNFLWNQNIDFLSIQIDEETLCRVDDSIIANYIPKLGDRIAIGNICQRQNDGEKKKTTKRSEVFEIFRTKIEGHVDC